MFILYIYIVDASFSEILITNNSDKSVEIKENERIGSVSELDAERVFWVGAEKNLAAKKPNNYYKEI